MKYSLRQGSIANVRHEPTRFSTLLCSPWHGVTEISMPAYHSFDYVTTILPTNMRNAIVTADLVNNVKNPIKRGSVPEITHSIFQGTKVLVITEGIQASQTFFQSPLVYGTRFLYLANQVVIYRNSPGDMEAIYMSFIEPATSRNQLPPADRFRRYRTTQPFCACVCLVNNRKKLPMQNRGQS